jgi:hypothetical protein
VFKNVVDPFFRTGSKGRGFGAEFEGIGQDFGDIYFDTNIGSLV